MLRELTHGWQVCLCTEVKITAPYLLIRLNCFKDGKKTKSPWEPTCNTDTLKAVQRELSWSPCRPPQTSLQGRLASEEHNKASEENETQFHSVIIIIPQYNARHMSLWMRQTLMSGLRVASLATVCGVSHVSLNALISASSSSSSSSCSAHFHLSALHAAFKRVFGKHSGSSL